LSEDAGGGKGEGGFLLLRKSALYVGRVWHTRMRPRVHAFRYPLAIFGLDLEEVEARYPNELWPLTWILSFDAVGDHLKNGEGLLVDGGGDDNTGNNTLTDRIFRLVADRTGGRFRPNRRTHAVRLVTHLRYYGYCFNPVSFYYLLSKQQKASSSSSSENGDDDVVGVVDAVVGEVSNTPWNEMHCYVLHPDSVDDGVTARVLSPEVGDEGDVGNGGDSKINYVFPKAFHVSPFMEMEYDYDWTFQSRPPLANDNEDDSRNDHLLEISNSLVTRGSSNDGGTTKSDSGDDGRDDGRRVQFHAVMKVRRRVGLFDDGSWTSPFRLALEVLVRYPSYCLIVQIWIHYEAFRLFCKGVEFQPHPEGSETAASRAIGQLMAPLFAAKDRLKSWKRKVKGE